ncbi:MAG: methylmalonyl-CoA mutase family protein [Bacillaceae bacterium]
MNFKNFHPYSFEDWKEVASKFNSPIEKEVEGIRVPILSTKQRSYPSLPSFPTECLIAQQIVSDSADHLQALLKQVNDYDQQVVHLNQHTIENCFNSFEKVAQSLQDVPFNHFCLEVNKDIEDVMKYVHAFFEQKEEKECGIIALSLSEEAQQPELVKAITFINEHNLSVKCAVIDTTKQEGTVVGELAFFFASAVQWVETLKEEGFEPKDVLKHLVWKTGVGHSVFLEISKLRACHVLWATLLDQYGVEQIEPTIISETKLTETTEENRHDTLVAATLQGFASIVGGANYLYLRTFDGEEGTRLARNVQHILLQESKVNRVKDPLAGAYTIEELTYDISEKAWQQFLEIEAAGGIFNYENKRLLTSRGEL